MKKGIKLKPCPFCGKEISVYTTTFNKHGVDSLTIYCCMTFEIESDAALMIPHNGKGTIVGINAVQKWNRREGEQE